MVISILNKNFVKKIMIGLLFLNVSCQNIAQISEKNKSNSYTDTNSNNAKNNNYTSAEIYNNIKNINTNSSYLNSYIDDTGKGLIIFSDNIIGLDSFKPTNYNQMIGTNISNSSISLNNQGNGFLTWLSRENTDKSLIGDLHIAKIENYKFITEEKYNSNDIYTNPPIVKIDNDGNGFISWDTSKQNKYIKITNFNLSKNIETKEVNYKNFISTIDNKENKINQVDITDLKEKYPNIIHNSNNYTDSLLLENNRTLVFATINDNKINLGLERGQHIDLESKFSYKIVNNISKTYKTKYIGVFASTDNIILTNKIEYYGYLEYRNLITTKFPINTVMNSNVCINKDGDGILLWVESLDNKINLRYTPINKYDTKNAFSPMDEGYGNPGYPIITF